MKIFGYIIIIVFSFFYSGAQNLIPNGGFEAYNSCPQFLSDFDDVIKFWTNASKLGTPNYYNACSSNPETGVPNNHFGNKPAQAGAAYIGIMTSNAIREYVTVTLAKPLKAGASYRLSFYSSIIKKPNCNSQGVQVLLTQQLSSIAIDANSNLRATPSLTFFPDYDKGNWAYNQSCYIAKGGEQKIVIGDFQFPKAIHNCPDGEVSYYFIDEIALIENVQTDLIAITKEFCNLPFPFKLSGSTLTGIAEDSIHVTWIWDGIKSSATKAFEKNGDYRLEVIKSDCTRQEYLFTINNHVCNQKIFIPNIFSPNDDGINDVWQIIGQDITIEKLSIFDRSGRLIFSENKNVWDGTFKNRALPSGVYVYLLQYKNSVEEIMKYKNGSITLIR